MGIRALSLIGKCSLSSIHSLLVIFFMLGLMTSHRSAFIPWRYSTNHHWFYLSWGCRFSKWAYYFQLPVKPIFPISRQPTSHPLFTLPSPYHPASLELFLPPGFKAFLSRLCSCRGRGSKQQDWSYICVLVLFQTFLVNRDGECIWLGEAEGARMKLAEVFLFSCVRHSGWLFVCSGMSLIWPPSTCKWTPPVHVTWLIRGIKAWERALPRTALGFDVGTALKKTAHYVRIWNTYV